MASLSMWFSKVKPPAETPFFLWSDIEHSVGVGEFDHEHKRLAALMSEVHATLQLKHDRALALTLMENLITATRTHFAHEEQTLAEAGYPGLEAHAEEHQELIQQARDLMRQFKGGTISALALPTFLKNWLIPHIQGSDRKYAAHLRRRGVH